MCEKECLQLPRLTHLLMQLQCAFCEAQVLLLADRELDLDRIDGRHRGEYRGRHDGGDLRGHHALIPWADAEKECVSRCGKLLGTRGRAAAHPPDGDGADRMRAGQGVAADAVLEDAITKLCRRAA